MLTRILAYAVGLLIITQGLSGWWLDHDERALGAVPAQIQAARQADANTATQATLKAVQARVDLDNADLQLALRAQAKADGDHEKAMLGIQHRQDLANFYFGDAAHDKIAAAWAAQPVPLPYLLGLCAVLGDTARGCGHAAGGVIGAESAGGGPGPHGGDEPAGH